MRQAIRSSFGKLEQAVTAGVAARLDIGTPYTSRYFQTELRFYGIT